MDLDRIDKYLEIKQDDDVDESSNEKKAQIYRDGVYSLRSAFQEFSQYYMKGMGQMVQGKTAMDSKYKKLRDVIATAYERMDDAISKHLDVMSKESADKVATKRGY